MVSIDFPPIQGSSSKNDAGWGLDSLAQTVAIASALMPEQPIHPPVLVAQKGSLRVDKAHEEAILGLGEQFELGLPRTAHEQPAAFGADDQHESGVHPVDTVIGRENGGIDS